MAFLMSFYNCYKGKRNNSCLVVPPCFCVVVCEKLIFYTNFKAASSHTLLKLNTYKNCCLYPLEKHGMYFAADSKAILLFSC